MLDLVLATGVHWKRRVGGGLKASRGQGIYVRRGAASHCSHGWCVFRGPPSLQCYGASAGIRVVLAGPQTQLAGPQTQCHDASAADSSRARDTAPRDGNERDDPLAGVVAGGSQPRDRRARREVAHSRTAERRYDSAALSAR